MSDIPDAARKRSTHDLIDELDDEAQHAVLAAIAVGFPRQAAFVFAGDRNRLAALNRLVRKRGRPIGIVALHWSRSSIQFSCRPFQEYGGSDWAQRYLSDFGDVVFALYHGRRHPALFYPINN